MKHDNYIQDLWMSCMFIPMADIVHTLLMDTANEMNHLHYDHDGSSF